MNLEAVETLARTLMDGHGLVGWSLGFDRAKRRAGRANLVKREISLSQPLMELFNEDQVRKVVLHEIAHALVGPGHNHDRVWKQMCASIGGDPKARYTDWPDVDHLWQGVCPAGHTHRRHRRPSGKTSCAQCHPVYTDKFRINWHNKRTGERC